MKTLPKIETSQLLLRRMEAADFPFLIRHANNKKISANIFNIPYPYTETDAIFRYNLILQGLKNENRYIFVITNKESGEFLGEIGLNINSDHNHAEVGYWIGEPFWNKGFASEALTAVLSFGFESIELQKIFATHFLDNPSSKKVLLKSGMIKEAELIEHYKVIDTYKSVAQYRLLRHEYNVLINNSISS